MKFTVVWLPSAEQELARLWLTASDRAQVGEIADRIDATLSRDPLAIGESRGGHTRIVIAPPLTILYDVDEPNRLVRVWNLWRQQ